LGKLVIIELGIHEFSPKPIKIGLGISRRRRGTLPGSGEADAPSCDISPFTFDLKTATDPGLQTQWSTAISCSRAAHVTVCSASGAVIQHPLQHGITPIPVVIPGWNDLVIRSNDVLTGLDELVELH
jgi:hypothetical protein